MRVVWRKVHGLLRKMINSSNSSTNMAMLAGELFPNSLVSPVFAILTSFCPIYSSYLANIYLKTQNNTKRALVSTSYIWRIIEHYSLLRLNYNEGLNRCGKSCRLRWTNYLRPDIKRGKFSQEEEQTILHLHSILGNKYAQSKLFHYIPKLK